MPIALERTLDGTVITDKRALTRRAKERRRRQKLIEAAEEKARKETLVLGLAVTGATFAEIARQVGFSEKWTRKIYKDAIARPGSRDLAEFRAHQNLRLEQLFRSVYPEAVDAKSADKHEARNEALRIIAEMNKLEGAYPPAQLDIAGDLAVRREVSVAEIRRAAAEVQADRILRGELPLPALTRTSGNGAGVSGNGQAA